MRKLSNLLWLSLFLSLLTLAFEGISNVTLAQMRGEDSDRFFRMGNEAMEQQIREIQRESVTQQQEEAQAQNDDKIDDMDDNQNSESDDDKDDKDDKDDREELEQEREEKERELDTELEMKQPSDVQIRETPDNPEALDDNVPESPDEEIKIGD